MKTVLVRAYPYRCTHRMLGFPYWRHRAYELMVVDYGYTMAPSAKKVFAWAMDYLKCTNEEEEWGVIIEWN